MKPWTITQLERDFHSRIIPACHTPTEQQCAAAVHGKEVRRLAHEIRRTRRLTPGEIAIAEQYGYQETD